MIACEGVVEAELMVEDWGGRRSLYLARRRLTVVYSILRPSFDVKQYMFSQPQNCTRERHELQTESASLGMQASHLTDSTRAGMIESFQIETGPCAAISCWTSSAHLDQFWRTQYTFPHIYSCTPSTS